jgi:osmotically inducible protein OsmC
MSLADELAKVGRPPEMLEVTATCTFDKRDVGWRITRMNLEVRGSVAGLDAADFEEKAEAAKDGCPVSNALAGNIEITKKATFV